MTKLSEFALENEIHKFQNFEVKGKLWSKKSGSNERASNGSRDIPFQSEQFKQDGHRHLVDF